MSNVRSIGIIGVGHMGAALLKGMLAAQRFSTQQIYISGGSSDKAKQLATKLFCQFCDSNAEVAKNSHILILAVTPKVIPDVLAEIKHSLQPGALIISVASSFSIEQFYDYLPAATSITRAIPNIPVMVRQGMTAISYGKQVSSAQRQLIQQLFTDIGKVAVVDENKLDISSTVAGCSPAYVAVFVEALADAGVLAGLSRDEAYLLSMQAVLGAATVMLDNHLLPGKLKDAVCSPGGTTIRGVAKLEAYGLRHAVIEATKASAGIKE